MAKKRRLKRKVKIVLKKSLIIFVIFIGVMTSLRYFAPRYQLNKIGYEKEEIKAVMALEKEDREILLKSEKIDDVLDWMNLSKDVDRYHYYMTYRQIYPELENAEVVETVNQVFDYPDVFIFSENQNKEEFFSWASPNRIDEYLSQADDSKILKEVNDVSMLVNGEHQLSMSFEPNDIELSSIESTEGEMRYLKKEANEALKKMADEAKKQGYELMNNSSYRSYLDQEEIYQYYYDLYGQSYCDQYVATPGKSEHQTGLAVDLSSRSVQDGTYFVFGDSPDYDWVVEHAHEYGFILRFPKDKVEITGVANEPWHFRYVGKEAATKIYENNWTLEEYHAN